MARFPPIQRYILAASLLLLLAAPLSAFSAAPGIISDQTIEQKRVWFKEARKSLKQNDIKHYTELRTKLDGYPLTPYLDIWLSWKQLDEGSAAGIEEILSRYSSIPESHELHLAWIRHLAGKHQWTRALQEIDALSYGKPFVFTVQMQGLWHTGRQDDAARLVGKHWLKGERIKPQWRLAFSHWKRMGHPTDGEVWKRIHHQISRGKTRSARKSATYLSKKERTWLNRWQDMRRHPEKTLRNWKWITLGENYREQILIDGLKVLARRDAASAWVLLKRHKARLSTRSLAEVQRYTALRAARQHLPEAANWLASIPPAQRDPDVWQWQVRSLLLASRWRSTLKVIQAMPEDLRNMPRWRYWQARTLIHIGKKRAATAIFSELARDRGYYSFLSAERLQQPFMFSAVAYSPPPKALQSLRNRPGIRRAHEWLQLMEMNKAVREWYAALSKASTKEWKIAAKLASGWRWHDQAIRAAYKGNLSDFLELRFPMQYQTTVKTASERTGLSPSWILAIIRQESAFNPYARSRSGAMGLMQLMPRTGRQMAKERKIRLRSGSDLLKPEINICLGSAYLAKMLDRYDGRLAWAAAAYNAGPHRVDRWLSGKTENIDSEALIEAIPFKETRRYVQQVLAFSIVYDWKMKRNQTRLASLL